MITNHTVVVCTKIEILDDIVIHLSNVNILPFMEQQRKLPQILHNNASIEDKLSMLLLLNLCDDLIKNL